MISGDFNILYSWEGQNYNLSQQLQNEKTLANVMFNISRGDLYASSYAQLEKFCSLSLNQYDKECFYAVFVFELNGVILGFLNARIAFSDVEIDYVCVDPHYRRQHIAHNLFSHFDDIIAKKGKFKKMFLEVGIENLPAIKFYETRGFKRTSIRKKYYKNSEDALVMTKEV